MSSGDEKAHIYRSVPPWRSTDPLTHCGREPAALGVVLVLDDAVARWKREGSTRAAYTMCMTCVSRAKNHGNDWYRWEDDPLGMLSRDQFGPHAGIAKQELHALAALVASHPDEFSALMSAGNDFTALRARKQPRRTVSLL